MNVKIETKRGLATGVFCQQTKKITILAGSILNIDPFKTRVANNIKQNYDEAAAAVKNGEIVENNLGVYEVISELADLSVSGSSVIVTGAAGSGWKKWKLDNGDFLDVLRNNLITTDDSAKINKTKQKEPLEANDCGCSNKSDENAKNSCEELACQFIEKINEEKRRGKRVDLSKCKDWFAGAFAASGVRQPKGVHSKIEDGKPEIEIIIKAFLAALKTEKYCGQSRFDYLLPLQECSGIYSLSGIKV